MLSYITLKSIRIDSVLLSPSGYKVPTKRSDNFIAENSEAANFFFPTFRRNSCEKKICISCFCNKWWVRVLRMGLYQKSNTVTKLENSQFSFTFRLCKFNSFWKKFQFQDASFFCKFFVDFHLSDTKQFVSFTVSVIPAMLWCFEN